VSTLSAPDRTKLAKLLAMLGSDQPGEVLNAAAAAHRLVVSKGASWHDVLVVPAAVIEPETPHLTGWRLAVDQCLRQADRLSDREFSFLSSLSSWRRPLTVKQQGWLDQITASLAGGQP
jgi:hypothetical protein